MRFLMILSTALLGQTTPVEPPKVLNWDAGRWPFSQIVIHHSATSKETTADQIDAIQKESLYIPHYKKTPMLKGLPVHSGHVVNGKERFIAYHHLIYWDGKVTTELSPLVKLNGRWYIDHVGWHAGDWEVNCSSIGTCLVGDFTKEEPPEKQLKATAGLIAYYKTLNPRLAVSPHRDWVNTECPGKTWPKWKEKIMPH